MFLCKYAGVIAGDFLKTKNWLNVKKIEMEKKEWLANKEIPPVKIVIKNKNYNLSKGQVPEFFLQYLG